MHRTILIACLLCVGCGRPTDVRVVDSKRATPSTTETEPGRLTDLAIGDPAPPLRLGGFVKGEPFTSFEPGRIYVVEFSATWCGPCRAAIPHLTKLQQQYPDVTFLSVYVREEDRDAPRKIVEEMGDRIGYRVATDDVPDGGDSDHGAMWRTWMLAAEIRGIPELFVVDGTGRIIAITDPRVLEEPLASIVAGKWDIEAAKARHRERTLVNRQRDEFDKRLDAILDGPLLPATPKLLSAFKAEFPKGQYQDEAVSILWKSFRRFARPDGDDDLTLAAAKELVAFYEAEYPQHLADCWNGIAWEFVDPGRTQPASQSLLVFALDAARRADELAKESDMQVADTFARALFLMGNAKLAFRAQQRAVRLAMSESDRDLPLIAGLRGRLREYAALIGEDLLDDTQP